MEIGRLAQERIRTLQVDWSAERISAGKRAAVYAVATADRLGRADLFEIRIAAETEDDREPVVRLALWFDGATYPPDKAPLSVETALSRLDDLEFAPEVLAAFRAVQPIIQPVGLE